MSYKSIICVWILACYKRLRCKVFASEESLTEDLLDGKNVGTEYYPCQEMEDEEVMQPLGGAEEDMSPLEKAEDDMPPLERAEDDMPPLERADEDMPALEKADRIRWVRVGWMAGMNVIPLSRAQLVTRGDCSSVPHWCECEYANPDARWERYRLPADNQMVCVTTLED